MREKDQADFDLERFIEMFDDALTSKDERVINALRSLMMMTILTKSESRSNMIGDRNYGPLRRMYEDLRHINSRLHILEEELREQKYRDSKLEKAVSAKEYWPDQDEYTLNIARQAAIALNEQKYDHIAKLTNSPGKLVKKEI